MTIQCQLIYGPGQKTKTFENRTAILIPAYNEADHIRRVLAACRSVQPALVLVVDDGSSDQTAEILADESLETASGVPVRVLRNAHNLGKQGSIRAGLRALIPEQVDAVALIDGDGQHDPGVLPALTSLLTEFDFVIGVRCRSQMPVQRRLSNWLVNRAFEWVGGIDFVDVQSGFRIYRKDLADVLAQRLPCEGGYALEHESLTLLAVHDRLQAVTLRAAATPVSCRYGRATSSMGPRHILHLARETIRQAMRYRRVSEVPESVS